MTNDTVPTPYGEQLVDLLVDEDRSAMLKELAAHFPDVTLNDRQLCDFELLATGAYSPLDGFMTRSDYESVLDRMRLQNGLLWPMPVCLDITDTLAGTLEVGQSLAIRDSEGFMLGVLHVEDIWPVEIEKEVRRLFPDGPASHEGAFHARSRKEHYVGGKLEVVSLPLHFEFKQQRMSPREIRTIYRKLGWQRVVACQTRHPVHRPQYEMTVSAMRAAKANLLLLPLSGVTQTGDFDFHTRVRCCRQVVGNYPPTPVS